MFQRKFFLFVFLSVFFYIIGSCSISRSIGRSISNKPFPKLKFTISDEHKKHFSYLNTSDDLYEIYEEFAKLEDLGDKTCEMVYEFVKRDDAQIDKFIQNIKLDPTPSKFSYTTGLYQRILAGCWNFYMMNDQKTDRDFQLVKKLYPNLKKNCYSVGFSQPYMMHNILNCENLASMDMDWRILYAHSQMLKIFSEEKAKDPDTLSKAMGEMKIGWKAQYVSKPIKREKPVNHGTFCDKGRVALCGEHFLKFQETLATLKTFDFQLTKLNHTKLSSDPEITNVMYFSNALDGEYTNAKEFSELMKNVSDSLQPGKIAILMYHVGGMEGFGLYEARKSAEGKYSVKTVCKESYLLPIWYKNRGPILTHLDHASVNKGYAPLCTALIR